MSLLYSTRYTLHQCLVAEKLLYTFNFLFRYMYLHVHALYVHFMYVHVLRLYYVCFIIFAFVYTEIYVNMYEYLNLRL